MRTAIELLRMLESTSEGVDDDGFRTCHHCPVSGWGFLEHDKDCPVREARAMLGKCRHGYTRGFDHGGGPCDEEEVGYLVEPDDPDIFAEHQRFLEGLPGVELLKGLPSDGSEDIAAKVESDINDAALVDNEEEPDDFEKHGWDRSTTMRMRAIGRKRIIRNAAQCRRCGDIIESKSVHDYVACTCGTIFVDGGREYLRRGSEDMHDLIELAEIEDGA